MPSDSFVHDTSKGIPARYFIFSLEFLQVKRRSGHPDLEICLCWTASPHPRFPTLCESFQWVVDVEQFQVAFVSQRLLQADALGGTLPPHRQR